MGYYGLEKIGYSTAFCVRFFDGVSEGKCFGGEILVKIYDKTKRNPSFFKEFLKDHCGILQGGFAALNRLEIFYQARSPKFLQCPDRNFITKFYTVTVVFLTVL